MKKSTKLKKKPETCRKGVLTFVDNAGGSDLVLEIPAEKIGTRRRRQQGSRGSSSLNSGSGPHSLTNFPEAFPPSAEDQVLQRRGLHQRRQQMPLFSPEHALQPLSASLHDRRISPPETFSPNRRRSAPRSVGLSRNKYAHRHTLVEQEMESDEEFGLKKEMWQTLHGLAETYFKHKWLQCASPLVWYFEILMCPLLATNSICSICRCERLARKVLFLVIFCVFCLLYQHAKKEFYHFAVVAFSSLVMLGSLSSIGEFNAAPLLFCGMLRLSCYCFSLI